MKKVTLSSLCLLLCFWGAALELPQEGWRFSNGSEFPGARGALHSNTAIPFKGGKTLVLSGDFNRGGSYVAAYRTLTPPLELEKLQFHLKSDATRVAVRLTDSADQTHQYFIPLTGNPAVWQYLEMPVTETSQYHWGGKNDGIIRGKIKQIGLVVHRADLPKKTGTIHIADIQAVEVKRMPGLLIMPLNSQHWTLNRGREFAPGADAVLQADGQRLLLKVDNSRHGDYASAVHRFKEPIDAEKLSFTMRGSNRQVAVRLTDSDGQCHSHVLNASGNPEKEQTISIDITGSKAHWGGKNDGVFRGPLTAFELVVRGKDFGASRQGETEFSAVTIDSSNVKMVSPDWHIADPAALFRHIGDNAPVVIQTQIMTAPGSISPRYCYLDYNGAEICSGTGKYDHGNGTLSAPPPPGRGFFELIWPTLDIRLGLMVDDPPPAKVDEYFAMDSSLSWGAPPNDEKGIRDFMRILKKNGILWNRDRLSWRSIEPEQGKYIFGGRFGLYRRFAEEEGIKALDTFHDTPAWNRAPVTKGNSGSRENVYPDNLISAAKSWDAIVKHWEAMKAFEVWNEPDVNFGNRFPAEYVTAFTKAVSRVFSDNGNNALVIGGVFSTTRPQTRFYRSYIDNGLLEDVDILSYHTYADVSAMEPEVTALRRNEIESGSRRAGIPYWVTESGKPRPWNGISRGFTAPDQYSAVEITGKAAELRALGIQRYFAFEFKFRQEKTNNFSLMDANRTPMRSMAAYLHLIRVLSHRIYVGDLKGINSFRARVFEGENDLVAVLYNGVKENRKLTIALPEALKVRKAAGIDGRPLAITDGRISNADGITYLFFDKNQEQQFVKADTPAMKLYRLAKDYKPQPRAAKPLVLQPITDLTGFIVCNRGFYVPEADNTIFRIRINNLGNTALTFVPDISLPPGCRLLEAPEAVTIAPQNLAEFQIRIAPGTSAGTKFQTVRVGDKNGSATPIAFTFGVFRRTELSVPAVPARPETPKNFQELNQLGDWINFSGQANWTAWQSEKTTPDIESRFRTFYTPEELIFQVLVKDKAHENSYPAFDSWRGDSVQLAVQQRKSEDASTGKFWELTAAKCAEGQTLYALLGPRRGLLRKSSVKFQRLNNDHYLYEIRLNGKELGLDLKSGSILAASIVVNSGMRGVRTGFLTWGHGIALEKNDLLFQILHL